MAVVLALFFSLSAYFFLTAHKRYALNQNILREAINQAQLLKAQQKELERKKGILNRIHGFVHRARSAGVEKGKWAYYDVNIEEPVPFEEAEQILGQTANSLSYYFKPITLEVKTQIQPDAQGPSTTTAAASGDSSETKTGDILLNLKGSFVVNRQ
jgi:hypothetical protein